MLYKKTAVITGASSGIGRAIANNLAKEGMHVYITGRSKDKLEIVRREIQSAGGTVSASAFDIRDISKLQGFINRAKEETAHLDVMVNNAGLHIHGTIAEGTIESWREMIDVNILALLGGTQAAILAMRQNTQSIGGHIINISSRASGDIYGATKHMVTALSEALTKELEEEPIRITNILPGAVATNFGRNADPAMVQGLANKLGLNVEVKKGEHLSDELLERIHSAIGKIFLKPDDIAKAVVYALNQPENVDVREIHISSPKEYSL